jgi:hypothetical protein
MVRKISVTNAKTPCYPEAPDTGVQDITKLLLTILPQILGDDTVVVHVVSNNIRRGLNGINLEVEWDTTSAQEGEGGNLWRIIFTNRR